MKNDLKAAFWNLYKTKPLKAITIKEVTAHAGYFRSTFYRYYDNIQHIYQEIEDELLQKWIDLVGKISTIESYDLYVSKVIDFFDKEGEKYITFLFMIRMLLKVI